MSGAARELFRERGYTATTIEAISTAADVPEQTIYSAFGAKRAILEEVRVAWIEEADVFDLYSAAMAIPDLCARLRAAAHWTRRQMELGHDVISAYQEAARIDPIAGSTWRNALEGRRAGLTEMIGSVRAGLRNRLSVERAVDIFVVCTTSEIYASLVLERGWNADEYERWLADLLCRELTPDAASAP